MMCARSASASVATRWGFVVGAATGCRNSISVSRMIRPGAERAARVDRAFEMADVALAADTYSAWPARPVRKAFASSGRSSAAQYRAMNRSASTPISVGRLRSEGSRIEKRIHAVVEIPTEPAVADEPIEGPVRRRDQAEIDLHRPLPAKALESPIFEDAQQLSAWADEREVADLVEKQRAAISEPDAPGFRSCAPVNAPFIAGKISDSNNVSGKAAQLTAWKFSLPRRLSS